MKAGADLLSTNWRIWALLPALVVVVCMALPARGETRASAQDQYEKAVAMRTTLENEPQTDRTIDEYKACVTAYRKVYLMSPVAQEATPALVAAAELYQAMGKQFDPQYFDNAIVTYDFLIREYPKSRYQEDALFTIGQIQQQDLKRLDDAEATFKQFLEHYPNSDKAPQAREALNQIDLSRESEKQESRKQADPATNSQQPAPQDQDRDEDKKPGTPEITSIRSWNAENYTRIVIDVQNAVKYESARIMNPDRIYFDLYQAKLDPSLINKTLPVDNGFLKAIRVAQNRAGIVRIVLDVDSVKEYSAFLLSNPYRLVIDVHGNAARATETAAAAPADANSENAKSFATPVATRVADASKAKVQSGPPSPMPAPNLKIGDDKSLDQKIVNRKTAADNSYIADAKADPLPKPLVKLPVRHADADSNIAPIPTTRDGQHSLTRALGLKINRIVIDPGHGGYDTGTIGPHGLAEKDLCLDVALRLGALIEAKLPGTQVIYTRKDDTFIPLEQRTAIANQAQADLFISIHANSSPDAQARGIETYYLNFATSNEATEVAARENALSGASIHDLQDMIQKIARNDKIEESREFAEDVQTSLAQRLQLVSAAERSRGVKKAPFVVLIGADMPSILTEISFLSNGTDEKLLRRAEQRQRIADGLFRGISRYLESLNSLPNNQQKLVSVRPSTALASDPNPK